jgi:creatinine amidohydrolase
MTEVNYELMLPHELQKAVEAFPVAYVPLGSLEWHGKHLALGNDTLKALGILEHTARKFGGVVLPPTYWGCVGKWHPWTFGDTGQDLLTNICRYIFRSLADVGFKVIIGVTGHDVKQQVDAMNAALEAVKAEFAIEGFAMMEGNLTDFGEHRMDHAAHWETAILMYLYPDCVDMHQIRDDDLTGSMGASNWNSPGIGGRDPRHGNANKQLGEMLVTGMADAIGKKAQQLLESLRAAGKLEAGPPPGGNPNS